MNRDYQDLIRTLIRDREATAGKGRGGVEPEAEGTTLGVPLVPRDEHEFTIDLNRIHAFRNLHTFVHLLAGDVMEQCGFGIADVMVRRRVDPDLTPELAGLGLDWVMLYARIDAVENIPFDHDHFSNCMQVIFRTLQTEKWGEALFPGVFGEESLRQSAEPVALLFPFDLTQQETKGSRYFLVEHSRIGRFLRITIEDASLSRLQLKHIPHRVVDQTAGASLIGDVHLIAEQIHQGMLRECLNNRTEYSITDAHQRDLFDHLKRCGLTRLEKIQFTWPTDDIQTLLIEKPVVAVRRTESPGTLVREIRLLEDPVIVLRLGQGDLIEAAAGKHRVFFDLSRYGSCLNVSFDERREVWQLEDYLAQMPVLQAAANARAGALVGVRLFLVHHVTAEVIGLIEAFKKAGCPAITTFFVKYAGVVPDAYLETLLSLPQDRFRFFGLQKLESRQGFSSRYLFSRLSGPTVGLEELEKEIFETGVDFLGAMRAAAGHLFLAEVGKARQAGERLFLVEDGGYLAPLLNRFAVAGATVAQLHAHFRLAASEAEGGLSVAEWLKGVYLGSVEHTKNGHDYNVEVADEFGRLEFPVATIAVSELKRGPEARECAVSIINATESILHRLGMLLSRRKILVLGSSGAIGGFLKEELSHRVGPERLFGVDIAATQNRKGEVAEFQTLDALGERLSEIDLVIGVIGASIFRREHFQKMVLEGRQKALFFVSGSTKTVEFSELEACVRELGERGAGEGGVKVRHRALRDLQTGILQGYRVSLDFSGRSPARKELYLLGELMPINFLYYGIPREVVDEVMAQLFTLSCGLVRRLRSAGGVPAAVLAVDRQIDADANDLPSPG